MLHTRRELLKWCAALPALALARELPGAAPSAASWQINGPDSPHQQPFDRAVRQFMEAQDVFAGQLAIYAGGSLVLNHGYTNTDHPARGRVTSQSLFRLASCSKIFTCAAITQLCAAGKLKLDEQVFPLLGINSPALANQHPDPRIDTITVKNLVYHAGGWVSGGPFVAKDGKHIRGSHFDPVFQIRRMSLDLDLRRPLTKQEMARYMYGRPLQFEPGKQNFGSTNGNSYSNFGYVMLGLVVEKVTGKRFVEFLSEPPLAHDGTHEVFLAHTSAQKHLPKEVWYEDPGMGLNALEPRSNTPVPYPYGGEGYMTELMDSGGGLATNAGTLARFISRHAVWNLGGRSPGYEREGSMAGTTSYAFSRPNGVDCAVIFNTRSITNQQQTFDQFTTRLRGLLDSTAWD